MKTNYKLLLIKTDGHVQCIDSPKIPKLETLQQLVDGFIEVTPCQSDYIFIVNDEGAFNASRYNTVASILQAVAIYGHCLIYGDAVVAIRNENEIRAMTEDECNAFLNWSIYVLKPILCYGEKRLYENEEATGAFKDINVEEWPPVEADEGADV